MTVNNATLDLIIRSLPMHRFQTAAFLALAIVLLTIAFAPISFAQEVVTTPLVVVADPPWWQGIVDFIFPAVGTVLMGALTWVAMIFKAKTSIEIDQKYRDLLHEALLNGIKAALVFFGWKPGQPVPAKTVDLTSYAANYAAVHNPDTLKHFDLKAESPELKQIASTKIAEATDVMPPLNIEARPAVKATPTPASTK